MSELNEMQRAAINGVLDHLNARSRYEPDGRSEADLAAETQAVLDAANSIRRIMINGVLMTLPPSDDGGLANTLRHIVHQGGARDGRPNRVQVFDAIQKHLDNAGPAYRDASHYFRQANCLIDL